MQMVKPQPAGSARLWIGRGKKARCKQGDLQSHGNACQQASQRASRDTDVPSGVGCLMTTWTRFVFFKICREGKWVAAVNTAVLSKWAQLNAQVGKGCYLFCKENTKVIPEYPHSACKVRGRKNWFSLNKCFPWGNAFLML